jgi:signal transduction histidine kinase
MRTRTHHPITTTRHEQIVGSITVSLPSFLTGGGVAGALLRSTDWTRTAVGPIDGWSESLRTTVGTILHSRHPMFLWWGPHLVQFYNDAYLPSFGQGKHPAAMGQRGADCWQEIWPVISPQIDDVMQRATSSWHEDQLVPIFRNGRIEEVHWTYGYSPVFEASGAVGGTLVVCTETTARVISDRRLRTLRLLVERLVNAIAPSAVLAAVADILGHEDADVPFALFYGVTAPIETPCLLQAIGLGVDASELVDADVGRRLEQLAGDSAVQLLTQPIAQSGCQWPEPVDEVFVARIASRDQRTASGYVVFGLSPRLPFDDSYRDYLRQLAEYIGQADARNDALHLRAVLENERNTLLEQAPVATAVLTGPEHLFLLANPLYRQMVGRVDLVGKPYAEVFPELVDTPMLGLLDRVYRTGEPFVTNEMLVRLDRDGTGRLTDSFFTFNLEPMRNAAGDVYGMMAVGVEITAIVIARRALEKAHQEREDLLLELERASRTKDEFLAMLGHELRNPLAPILTALQLMRMRGVQGGEKERAIIERQVKHMGHLVEDLLDVSRITHGTIQLTIERVLMNDVITKALEMASPLIEERQHRLTVEVADNLALDGDAGRLSQVIANVLTNAAKYTDRQGEIAITAQSREGAVWLTVRDNGMGIDPAMLRTVLEPFAQEHQGSAHSRGGLGLGLAIVRSLVAAHGGTVALHSDGRGKGTECVIRLPLSRLH